MVQYPSQLVMEISFPFGCQETPLRALVWPVRVVSFWPLVGFQMMQVLSQLVVASCVPSGRQASPVIAPP